MPINNPQELFIKMLSDVRQGTEKMTKIYGELAEVAQDPNIKEALQSRAFLQDKVLSSLDRCFQLDRRETRSVKRTSARGVCRGLPA